MKKSRICAGVATTLAVISAVGCGSADSGQLNPGAHDTSAPSDPSSPSTKTGATTNADTAAPGNPGSGARQGVAGDTPPPGNATRVIANTYQKMIALAPIGPTGPDGLPRIGKNTGCGIVHAKLSTTKRADGSVRLVADFTGSDATKNQDADADSYFRGAFTYADITEKGVIPAGDIKWLPKMTGERAFQKPLGFDAAEVGGTAGVLAHLAASEDNGVNNNPQPVLCLTDEKGTIVRIANATLPNGCTNVIQQAGKDGVQIPDPNNQRGPHDFASVDRHGVVAMQYNNQAVELLSLSLDATNKLKVLAFQRSHPTARHGRGVVKVAKNGASNVGFLVSVEANNQPADIGARCTTFDPATLKTISSTICLRSDRKKNMAIAEPYFAVPADISVNKDMFIGFSNSSTINRQANGNNGHAGGSQQFIVEKTTTDKFSTVQAPQGSMTPPGAQVLNNAGAFGRHCSLVSTNYGPNGEPAAVSICGSSTGTKGAFLQVVSTKTDGTLSKSSADLFPVSDYSDVAQLPAEGLRNPNNQAKGFIDVEGCIDNPGYGKGDAAFMPDVKCFTAAVVTGYADAAAAKLHKRDSLWLSLVPSVMAPGITPVPGVPTDKPGTNPDGTGPSPRTTAPAGTAGESGNLGDHTASTGPDGADRQLGGASSGCSVSQSSTRGSSAGLVLLAVAGVLAAFRRKQSRKQEEV